MSFEDVEKVLRYHFPDKFELEPEEGQMIVQEILLALREEIKTPIPKGEEAYYIDKEGKILYPLYAYFKEDAYQEGIWKASELGFGVDFLTEEEITEDYGTYEVIK